MAESEPSRNWVFLNLLAHGKAELRYPNFPLVTGPEDIATLFELASQRRKSKKSRELLKQFVERRGRQAATRLKKWLGLRRGRPRNFSKREVWAVAAGLREKNRKKYSWRLLARRLDSKGFANDPRGAMDRMRHGVGAVLKGRRGKSKSA